MISTDFTESYKDGKTSEELFKITCEKNGIECIEIINEDNWKKHSDFYLIKNNKRSLVDVKGPKRKNRNNPNFNYDVTWIELNNVNGKSGWVRGDADFIAFEQKDCFLIFKRVDVLKFTLKNMKKHTKGKGLYEMYTRPGRNDLLVLIKFEDLINYVDNNYKRLKI